MKEVTRRARSIRAATFELILMLCGILFVRREIWTLHIFNLTMPYWQEGMLLPLSAIDGGISGAYSRRRNVEHLPSYHVVVRWLAPIVFMLYVACAALCERVEKLSFVLLPGDANLWRTLGFLAVVAGLVLRLWSQIASPAALERSATIETPPDAPTAPDAPKEIKETASGETAEEAKPSGIQEEKENLAAVNNDPAINAFVNKIAAATTPGAPTQNADNELFPVGPYRLIRYPDATGRLIALCGIPLCFHAWLPLLAVPGMVILLKWHISDQEAFRISQLGDAYLQYRRRTWLLVPFIY